MSENTAISFSNTPIFDQLLAEFAARGKHYESLIAGGAVNLRPAKYQGVRAPYAVMDELQEVEQTDKAVNAATNHAAPVVTTLRQHFEKEAVIDQITIDTKKTQPIPVSGEYLQDREAVMEGITNINTYRRKNLESNDPEPVTGRP